MCDVNKRMLEENIVLPTAQKDTGFLRMSRPFGKKYVFISGMGPVWNGELDFKGSIPSKVSVEAGQKAARYCALNILSSLQNEIMDLNKVKQVVKLLVFVSSDPGFANQHIVANGASELLIKVFGEEKGKAARSAVGVAGLPADFPVEVEAIFELK